MCSTYFLSGKKDKRNVCLIVRKLIWVIYQVFISLLSDQIFNERLVRFITNFNNVFGTLWHLVDSSYTIKVLLIFQ